MLPAFRQALSHNLSRVLSAESTSSITSHRWYADIVLLATAAMWGINIIVFKYAIDGLSPWVFNGFRLVFATVTLGGLSWVEQRMMSVPTPSRKPNWLRVVGFCFLSGLLYMLAFVKGIESTTAGNTALLLASMPMWTAILSYFFLAERLKWMTWAGLMVTLVGTMIVTMLGGGNVDMSDKYLTGNLFMIAAAITWAAGTVLSKSILETVSPLRLAFLSSLMTAPIHLCISGFALAQQPEVMDKLMQPAIVLAIIYSGVFSTGVAYATWHAGVRAVGGSHAAVYQNFVTIVAVGGGWILLGEQVMAAQIVGGLLTIVGLLIMRRGRA